jgi:hypothetical protein
MVTYNFYKRGMALALALVLAMMLGNGNVFAQGSEESQAPGSWASSINLQNLENSNNDVSIEFRDSNGNVEFTHTDTLTPLEGKSYYLPALDDLDSGQYSAVINSTGQLKAVVNSESQSPNTGYSYSGLDHTEIAQNFSFPGLYKDYYGFNSEVVLQNVTSTSASVQLSFKNASGSYNDTIEATIPAMSSRVFALQDLTALPAGGAPTSNQPNGLYSLVVTSDQNLAAVANLWTAAYFGEAGSYNSFVGGSTTAYAPALYNNYYNFVSALTVQAITASVGTVTYSNGVTENFDLAAGESVEYYQPLNTSLPSGNTDGVFSAKVETSNGGEVVTLVTVEDKNQGLLASYNGATSTSDTINVPVALMEYYGYFSALTVQNVGTEPTTLTFEFASGETITTPEQVQPNGTFNCIQIAGASCPIASNTTTSAIVTSSNGQPLVTVVQENNPTRYQQSGGGDFLFAYTASPQ